MIIIEQSSIIITKNSGDARTLRYNGLDEDIQGTAMALDRSRDRGYVGLRATSALAMALFEQSGLRGLLDERIPVDKRRKLSIGYAVKAFIGDMWVMRTAGH